MMIHRALLGSMERFAGILIEHYGGRFPDWLAPTQAAILPVADRHDEAAEAMLAELTGRGVRARVDARSESVGRKIRDAELGKVPYMLVLGDRELEAGGRRRPLPRRRRPRGHGCRSRRRPAGRRGGLRSPIRWQSPSRCLYSAAMQVSQTTSRRF